MQKSLDEILEMIKDGKISIRQASENSDFGRDFLKKKLIEKYGTDPQSLKDIEAVLKNNKANSTAIEIDSALLEDVFLRTMSGEISLEQAREELGGIDKETLKSKFVDFIEQNSGNEELLRKYIAFQKPKSKESSTDITDYTKLNFRLLAINMILNKKSQTQLAAELDIPVRTVSREFEKFSQDTDKTLYKIVKFYNERTMKKQKIERFEEISMIMGLNQYKKRHPELLSDTVMSKEEQKLERMKRLVSDAERLKGEGLTQEEIAKRLGTSVSGLRRAKIFVKEQEMLNSSKKQSTLPTSPNDDGGRE